MKEIFIDIKGYEGLYQVSNYGRVKALYKIVHHPRGNIRMPEKMLKLVKHCQGYLAVGIGGKLSRKVFLVHRLVAMHFIPNIENVKNVNHIDFDKTNNHVSNLEWVTQLQNVQHTIKAGRRPIQRGEDGPMSNFTNADILNIRELVKTMKQADIARMYNAGTDVICRIINRKSYYNI